MNKITLIIKILAIILFEAILNKNNYLNRIAIFDIGTGDSALLQYEGSNVLLDGGPSDNVLYKLEGYSFSTKPYFDYIIVTHLHDDHYSGIEEIINRYDYGILIFPNICGYKEKISVIEGLDSKKIVFVDSSMFIEIGNDLNIDFLHPFYDQKNFCSVNNNNENNNSIVALLKINENSLEKAEVDRKKSESFKNFLFMGDAEKEVEKEILMKGFADIKEVDILKAGHHCSKTSNSEIFLRNVNPNLAICSTGVDNKFGHPSKEVLKRFEDMGLKYIITYDEGDLVFKIE